MDVSRLLPRAGCTSSIGTFLRTLSYLVEGTPVSRGLRVLASYCGSEVQPVEFHMTVVQDFGVRGFHNMDTRTIVVIPDPYDEDTCCRCLNVIPSNCPTLIEWGATVGYKFLCRDCCTHSPSGIYWNEGRWYEQNPCTGPCLARHLTFDPTPCDEYNAQIRW